eukprot:6172076-Pleurochrysis_carterae.AAC.4
MSTRKIRLTTSTSVLLAARLEPRHPRSLRVHLLLAMRGLALGLGLAAAAVASAVSVGDRPSKPTQLPNLFPLWLHSGFCSLYASWRRAICRLAFRFPAREDQPCGALCGPESHHSGPARRIHTHLIQCAGGWTTRTPVATVATMLHSHRDIGCWQVVEWPRERKRIDYPWLPLAIFVLSLGKSTYKCVQVPGYLENADTLKAVGVQVNISGRASSALLHRLWLRADAYGIRVLASALKFSFETSAPASAVQAHASTMQDRASVAQGHASAVRARARLQFVRGRMWVRSFECEN